jgi:hypothetical protein
MCVSYWAFPVASLGPAVISSHRFQTLEITLKTLTLAAIRCSLMFTAVTASLFSVQPAQAGYIVTLEQLGSDVVATGSGPIDLTGLTFAVSTDNVPGIAGELGLIDTGSFGTIADLYDGAVGPATFGSGDPFLPNTASGDFVGIVGITGLLSVPQNYVSGAALSDSMTFNNATLASVGVTPGTYVWTWGTGLENQNFTLVIGGAGVPDGGSTVSLLGFALLGLTALRRKLSC